MTRQRAARPSQRSGLAAVTSLVVCLLLWQIAGSMLADASPIEARFPEIRDVMQRADGRPAIDVVVFGTSRLKGVPAERLQRALAQTAPASVLNASVPAGDPFAYDRILTALQQRNQQPRLAVVEVNPEMLTPGYRFLRASVARFFGWPEMIRWRRALVPSRSLNEAIGSRFAPFYKHRHALWAWMAPSPAAAPAVVRLPAAELDALAAAPDTPLANETERQQRALNTARAYEGWMGDYQVAGPIPATLQQFLARCRADGIDVVLLAPPATAAVRQIYTPEREARFQAFIRDVTSPLAIPFIDYRTRLDDRFFDDGVHLSSSGGARLAEIMAAEVIAPRLTAPAQRDPAPGR